jgi:methionyl aminopeptidase
VLTEEPFLSLGGLWAKAGSDGRTLQAEPRALAEPFDQIVVAADRGAIAVTLSG